MTLSFENIVPTVTRLASGLIGVLWCWIEPTIPFVSICAFAVLIDCFTAWRLNRRIRKKFTKEVADGKLKSNNMGKMIPDLLVIFLCILLADKIDKSLLPHWGGIHLANYAAAIFCLTQVVSILENESSCNGSTWAIVMQKILADKTERHLDIDINEFKELKKQQDEKDKKEYKEKGKKSKQ